jgi:hypothetical protein
MLFVCAFDARRGMRQFRVSQVRVADLGFSGHKVGFGPQQFRVPQVRVANLGFSGHKVGSGRKYL